MLEFTQTQLNELLADAIAAAKAASAYILAFDRQQLTVLQKEVGSSAASSVVTQVDVAAQALILKTLQPSIARFDLAVLAEESVNQTTTTRLIKDYFWCIDPLDGTLPFIENQPGFAVSIALVNRAGQSILAVVIQPSTQIMWTAILGQGSVLEELSTANKRLLTMPMSKTATHASGKLHWSYDRSFQTEPVFADVQTLLSTHFELQPYASMGGVMNALLLSQVAEPALYFKLAKAKLGGGSIWDFAATSLIMLEAGAWVSDMAGHPLDLNRPDSTFMNHRGVLYASNAELANWLISLHLGE